MWTSNRLKLIENNMRQYVKEKYNEYKELRRW